jgi:hypothetical protein
LPALSKDEISAQQRGHNQQQDFGAFHSIGYSIIP